MAGDPAQFFICGCPKSGTTWVQLLLDGHPEICCAGESQLVFLVRAISRLIEDHNHHQRRRNSIVFGGIAGHTPFPEVGIDDERAIYRALVARMLEKLARKPAARAVGDKTPDVAQHLAWFRDVAPHARFIHVIRDGRDVAVSGWHHLQRTGDGAKPMAASAFREYALLAAQVWGTVILQARAAAVAMPERYLEIRYEDLHQDCDGVLARLLEFLGVSADPAIRRACRDGARFEVLTGGRAAGHEDPGAFLRKGVTGDWRNWFDAELNAAYVGLAGPMLTALGYALS
jgi:hypothetical protein